MVPSAATDKFYDLVGLMGRKLPTIRDGLGWSVMNMTIVHRLTYCGYHA